MSQQPKVGNWTLGKVLGVGSFGKVRLGVEDGTGKRCAIKIMEKSGIVESEMTLQVRREVTILKALDHPNIVKLHTVLRSKTKLYVVMEHVSGGELFEQIMPRGRSGPVDERTARKYFRQLVNAVNYCHTRGVSHRDLKPENLLVDEYGNLKITDFGLSAIKNSDVNNCLLYTQVGTPEYVAPEMILGDSGRGYNGGKLDSWACGVILFHMITGHLPFTNNQGDGSLEQIFDAIIRCEFTFPPWVSESARDLIGHILVGDPEKRFHLGKVMQHPWFTEVASEPQFLMPKIPSLNLAFLDEDEAGANMDPSLITPDEEISASPFMPREGMSQRSVDEPSSMRIGLAGLNQLKGLKLNIPAMGLDFDDDYDEDEDDDDDSVTPESAELPGHGTGKLVTGRSLSRGKNKNLVRKASSKNPTNALRTEDEQPLLDKSSPHLDRVVRRGKTPGSSAPEISMSQLVAVLFDLKYHNEKKASDVELRKRIEQILDVKNISDADFSAFSRFSKIMRQVKYAPVSPVDSGGRSRSPSPFCHPPSKGISPPRPSKGISPPRPSKGISPPRPSKGISPPRSRVGGASPMGSKRSYEPMITTKRTQSELTESSLIGVVAPRSPSDLSEAGLRLASMKNEVADRVEDRTDKRPGEKGLAREASGRHGSEIVAGQKGAVARRIFSETPVDRRRKGTYHGRNKPFYERKMSDNLTEAGRSAANSRKFSDLTDIFLGKKASEVPDSVTLGTSPWAPGVPVDSDNSRANSAVKESESSVRRERNPSAKKETESGSELHTLNARTFSSDSEKIEGKSLEGKSMDAESSKQKAQLVSKKRPGTMNMILKQSLEQASTKMTDVVLEMGGVVLLKKTKSNSVKYKFEIASERTRPFQFHMQIEEKSPAEVDVTCKRLKGNVQHVSEFLEFMHDRVLELTEGPKPIDRAVSNVCDVVLSDDDVQVTNQLVAFLGPKFFSEMVDSSDDEGLYFGSGTMKREDIISSSFSASTEKKGMASPGEWSGSFEKKSSHFCTRVVLIKRDDSETIKYKEVSQLLKLMLKSLDLTTPTSSFSLHVTDRGQSGQFLSGLSSNDTPGDRTFESNGQIRRLRDASRNRVRERSSSRGRHRSFSRDRESSGGTGAGMSRKPSERSADLNIPELLMVPSPCQSPGAMKAGGVVLMHSTSSPLASQVSSSNHVKFAVDVPLFKDVLHARGDSAKAIKSKPLHVWESSYSKTAEFGDVDASQDQDKSTTKIISKFFARRGKSNGFVLTETSHREVGPDSQAFSFESLEPEEVSPRGKPSQPPVQSSKPSTEKRKGLLSPRRKSGQQEFSAVPLPFNKELSKSNLRDSAGSKSNVGLRSKDLGGSKANVKESPRSTTGKETPKPTLLVTKETVLSPRGKNVISSPLVKARLPRGAEEDAADGRLTPSQPRLRSNVLEEVITSESMIRSPISFLSPRTAAPARMSSRPSGLTKIVKAFAKAPSTDLSFETCLSAEDACALIGSILTKLGGSVIVERNRRRKMKCTMPVFPEGASGSSSAGAVHDLKLTIEIAKSRVDELENEINRVSLRRHKENVKHTAADEKVLQNVFTKISDACTQAAVPVHGRVR